MAITTLLLDADGVVQTNAGLIERITSLLAGRATFGDASVVEQRAITGHVDLRAALQEFLDERGIDLSPETLLDAWCHTEPDSAVFAMIDGVRAGGTRVCLATNQQPVRGRWMRATLGYERHFDELFFSHELGLAKPDPAYFRVILERIGAVGSDTLFIDDMQPNVAGARDAGLLAEWHDRTAGAAGIARILDAHGVPF